MASSIPPSGGRLFRLGNIQKQRQGFSLQRLGRVATVWEPKRFAWTKIVMGVEAARLRSLCDELALDVTSIFNPLAGKINPRGLIVGLDNQASALLFKKLNRLLGQKLRLPTLDEGMAVLDDISEARQLRAQEIDRFMVFEEGRYMTVVIPLDPPAPEPAAGLLAVLEPNSAI